MSLHFFFAMIFIFAVIYIIVAYIHFPKEKLSDEIKQQILSNGLIHFTTMENAYNIQKEGLAPQKGKALFPSEKNFVWMYINNNNEFQERLDTIHQKGERKAYDAVVTFNGITEDSIRLMRYRKSDMAIVYNGLFKADRMAVSVIDHI